MTNKDTCSGDNVSNRNKCNAVEFMKEVNQEMIDKTQLTYAGHALRKRFKDDAIAQHQRTFTIKRKGIDVSVLFTALFSKCGITPVKMLLVEPSI
jgi:hypothetical protein